MSTLDFLNNLPTLSRQVMDLPLDQIQPDPEQPRKSLQAVDGIVDLAVQEALEELAADIADQGLHQPITVREVAQGRYLIVMGERRWRAFKLNQSRGMPNSDVIPAIVRQDLSAARLRLSQLSENLHRSDLSDLEIATFLKATLEAYPDLKKQDLAKLLKRNNQWVSRILALLDPRWASLIKEGIISYASLLEHFKSLPEHQQTKLVNRAKNENRPLTSGDIKQAREETKGEQNGDKLVPSVIPTADTNDLANVVQDLIEAYAPKDESYTPPVHQPSMQEQYIQDAGGDFFIATGPQSLSRDLMEKREAKLTLEQMESLLNASALINKRHIVSVMLPVEEIREMIDELGGEQPENDSLLVMALVNRLNTL